MLAGLAAICFHLHGVSFAAELAAVQQTDLRGYGRVRAEFAPGRAVFRCADAGHADVLLGKLLADLFWDAGDEAAERRVEVAGVTVTVHAWAPYGVLAVGRTGSDVVAVGAPDEEALRARLRQHPELLHGSPVFAAEKPYPRYLDHYDLRAYKAYTHAMRSVHGLGLESHWPFIRQLGLRIAEGAPVLGAWAGREFTGGGVALTPAPAGIVVPGGAPVAAAKWDDGTLAISSRRIGKGRVIQLGSWFWSDHGAVEMEFLDRLLTDLGIKRTADASDRAIWARKATSRNGLQDWLLTCNDSETERAADVRLAVAAKPAAVWDLLTRTPVEATFADGFVTIPQVQYGPRAVRLFAVKRADLADALPFWWGEKTRYWKRPPAASSPEVAAAKQWLAGTAAQARANTDTIPFSRWRFLADRGGAVGGQDAWLQPGFDDRGWQLVENGPWNLMDSALADWRGVGLYRAAFTTPAAWKGRRVILNLFDWDGPIVYDQGELFVNGAKVADYQAHGWSQAYAYDVTPLLRDRGNVLTVRVQGGKELAGIAGSVWLEPELRFAAEMDLAGAWRLVKADFRTEEPTQLPGTPAGRSLRRDVDLPAAWTGKMVFLHLETDAQWTGCVVVNGRLITTNGYMHPFAPRCEVNLTPHLVPGRNRLELWPYATVPTVYVGTSAEVPMPVRAVRLGLAEQGPLGHSK